MLSLFGASGPFAVIAFLLGVLALVAVLYLARLPNLRLLRTGAVALTALLRRTRRRLSAARLHTRRRLRAAIIAEARQREVHRAEIERRQLSMLVDRDLAALPALQRRIRDELQQVDEDYHASVETPPDPPRWLEAVESVAALRGHDDPSVARVLEEMHATLDRSCHETLRQHRQASQRRQRLLGGMRGRLQRLEVLFVRLERTVGRLAQRARRLDRRLDQLERIQRLATTPVRRLAGQASVRLVAAGLGLAVILGAGYVEFHLLRRPLEELGQAGGIVPGPFPFRDQIVLAVLASLALLGWLGLETTGHTRLLPGLAAGDSRLSRITLITLGTLMALLLASIAGLAWTRDYLLAQDLAVDTLLGGGEVSLPVSVAVAPALAQSVISVVFGLLLTLLAVPLETLLRDGRLALQGIWLGILEAALTLVDLLALLVVHGARLLIAVYDVIVFLPLALERRQRQAPAVPSRDRSGDAAEEPAGARQTGEQGAG
ncbi:hypothetical protein [Sediminicurvatus halobius]|uniref:Uncharacterized protein n=1 Tax=Sediminicurvatus halobius TaxID=2182432 RepID=A0A2U2N4A0_9GAMM|nr:hypothetical protein [Spiribacter halobius]PWG63940.1 hypothetical protein DEM34_07025 [Spiribacter halobius]UEX76355.1 hypothetical protein LMH63_10295 [Spiribacter halobius]